MVVTVFSMIIDDVYVAKWKTITMPNNLCATDYCTGLHVITSKIQVLKLHTPHVPGCL